ncbi:hypothetical protein HanXRQr2_Chr08g0317851 [Helianthus annuus]|uniref:Transmembrane protein n=1 Tax=Helianthus annuus TaxID=4232 RepID=A0A9K3NAY5_HELAN|nr:uncharacterized protein LOC110871687 [Helianthus annuus]KAF5793566.1 hypothetical protein HanXRQr2_Chr08g0317851 [Helianthus annuus]KAJ0537312.1 hypothetical protein HanHA300_Chr08g0262091 [Helianthus annuus]KAJ0551904.1 hypothetical protein HanHA89_Chr08g0278941 [Helianthus annuus]
MSVQQTDQPPLVYPVSSETSPPSHPQTDGSFGAVFIVLAVIVAISTIACFLGRLCNKRYNNSKPSKRSRHIQEKDMKPSRNAFQTKDGDIEFGYDKRFSSAKVANNGEPIMGPNMGQPNSPHEPNMGRPNMFHEPNIGRPNLFHEPNMGRPNSFREQNMGQPNSPHEPNMGRPNLFHEPNMGRPNLFPEPNMGPNLGRPNSFRETNMSRPNLFHEPNTGPNLGRPNSFRETNMGPNLGQSSSFREPPMGRADSFHEPSMGRPNSFRKGEFRDDHMRFGGDEDYVVNIPIYQKIYQ